MRKFLGTMFERIAAWLNKRDPQQENMEKKDGISLPLFLEETPVCTDVKKEKKPKQIKAPIEPQTVNQMPKKLFIY